MKFRLLALAAVAFIPGLASAATATAVLPITANVLAACTITATSVAFGTYDQFSATAKDATGTLSVACTQGSAYTVALGNGANAGSGGTSATRKMANGANTLGYQLYSDSGRTTSWGSSAAGTGIPATPADTVAGTGSGTSQTLTVYGRIPASQLVPVGNYADSIAVTLTY